VCSVVAAGNRLISKGLASEHPKFGNRTFWESCSTHATAAGHDVRNSSSTSLGAAKSKLDVPKCTNPSATPHSQAIAIMLSKDKMPAEQLRSSMDALSQQLLQNIGSYSSTELSAFAEACRCETGALKGQQKLGNDVLYAR
jgi:hypothetical protein